MGALGSRGMGGAVRRGLDACWYNPTGAPLSPGMKVEAEIHSLDELLEIL